jgi:transposase InsO family protein
VENQTEEKIKVLRTDNEGEFCGNFFECLCKKCGITCQNTTPYTPQKNGVVERINFWVGVIFFEHVCGGGGGSYLMTTSDDPSLVVLFVSCMLKYFLGGFQGG